MMPQMNPKKDSGLVMGKFIHINETDFVIQLIHMLGTFIQVNHCSIGAFDRRIGHVQQMLGLALTVFFLQ